MILTDTKKSRLLSVDTININEILRKLPKDYKKVEEIIFENLYHTYNDYLEQRRNENFLAKFDDI